MKQKTLRLLFLVSCLEDKSSLRLPLCTRLCKFQSGSSGPFCSQDSEDCILSNPAINEQTSSTISKPPKKVDIDIFGVRQNRLSLQKLRKHYELRLKPTFKAKLIRKKLKFFNGISFLCHRLSVQVHAITPNTMIKLSFDLFQLIVPIRDIFNIGF